MGTPFSSSIVSVSSSTHRNILMTHMEFFNIAGFEVAQQHTLMNMEMEMSGARDEETKGNVLIITIK